MSRLTAVSGIRYMSVFVGCGIEKEFIVMFVL